MAPSNDNSPSDQFYPHCCYKLYIQFIKFTRDDIQLIIEFNREYSPPAPLYHSDTTDELNALFDNNTFVCYGIYLKKEMIVQVSYIKDSDNVYFLGTLVVQNHYRNQGLGSKIFSEIKEEIMNKGGKEVVLTVSPQNKSAIAFYRNQGFKIYDRRRDVYGSGADRYYMKLTL